MTKPAEGGDGDFAADLTALRRDVVHLAETLSKLVQYQTKDRVRAASSEIEADASIQESLTRVIAAQEREVSCFQF